MPRIARIRAPGYPLHIVQRGHNRADCFRFAGDFERYFDVLAESARKHECLIHAFVLMTNHVHLLITSMDAMGASRMMKQVAQKHAQALNRREQRTGSFWSDRFYSSVIQSDRYLLACHRYIEMNPVRAGIVPAPRLYRWSSYRHNAEGITCPIVTPHSLYLELGSTPEQRERAYRAMFNDMLDASVLDQFRTAARACRAVGDEDFHRQLGEQLGVCTYARKPGRPAASET
jgi:putative transposase